MIRLYHVELPPLRRLVSLPRGARVVSIRATKHKRKVMLALVVRTPK